MPLDEQPASLPVSITSSADENLIGILQDELPIA